MDVIRIFNGLGNQMSQYAFYYAKKKRHPWRTCFITNRTESENIHNGYELERLFGIKRNALKDRVLYHIYDAIYKHVFGYRILFHLAHECKEQSNYDFDSKKLEPSPKIGFTFFWGGWHSEKYFADYKHELCENVFRFDETKLNTESKKWKEQIENDNNSCSLHIRRGDFLKDKKWADAITPDYYDNAIAYIKLLSAQTTFYVFSNDVEWCRQKFGEQGFNYIDCNKGIDSWQDMFLMSRCRNHINANSSFSWWASWLSPYEEGVIVCPKAFISTVETKDIYPDKWIKL